MPSGQLFFKRATDVSFQFLQFKEIPKKRFAKEIRNNRTTVLLKNNKAMNLFS